MNKMSVKITQLLLAFFLAASPVLWGCAAFYRAVEGQIDGPQYETTHTAENPVLVTPSLIPSEASVTPEGQIPRSTPSASQASVYPPIFAAYQLSPVTLPDQFRGGYGLPLDLGEVKGLDRVQLSAEQLNLLAQNGFVAARPIAGKYREFYQIYESYRYALDQPVFVTTDAVFHVYHLIFDKMLRDLEREEFLPALEALTVAMLDASANQLEMVRGTAVEEPARRNLAFFTVAARLLELQIALPMDGGDLVAAELALLDAHDGPAVSPIWDRPDLPDDKKLIEDYSQYIPRGHYTHSDALKRYFRAMMWYGRLTFRLRDAIETQRALLITQALRTATAANGQSAEALWRKIFEPTVFIVGKADDLSFFEYAGLADQVWGPNAAPVDFSDEGKLAAFTDLARSLPAPQVNSMWVWIWEDRNEATQGFRFMGQRFTLDAYVFGQMIWRKVGTLEDPRGLPKALDFFAAMGSVEARELLNEMNENRYVNFDSQMDKVTKEVASLQLDSWTQNLYWSWLFAFQPLIQPKDLRYPEFMQSRAWQYKDLHTALGSWTELKHDTLLYAKQVMAEMGGGQPDEPPHGYVEPNPEAFARLYSLAQMTMNGLEQRALLSDLISGNLENLMDLLAFLKTIAEKELRGETLSDEEYWRIQYFGGEIEGLTLASSDCAEGDPMICRDLSELKAALVADVATGLEGGSLAVLEQGIGQPTEIYVVLPDAPYRLAVGAIYTYYEFTVPPDQRMTDETWRELVEKGAQPPQPVWTGLFFAP